MWNLHIYAKIASMYQPRLIQNSWLVEEGEMVCIKRQVGLEASTRVCEPSSSDISMQVMLNIL
jgi:hypothetical protein